MVSYIVDAHIVRHDLAQLKVRSTQPHGHGVCL